MLHIGPEINKEQKSIKTILKDAAKQILVSLLVLVVVFLGMNWSAYYKIIKHRIDVFLGIETDQSINKAISSEKIEEKLTQTDKNALKAVKEVPELKLEIMPPDERLVIPRINQNIPVVTASSTNLIERNWGALEKDIQEALKNGVVHYPGTSWPNQTGNTVITGHSSYFPWDPGSFKDVFALLNDVVVGDKIAFYYKQHKYIYQVSDKKIVMPSNIEILKQTTDKKLTLITCYPVGTNLKRLVVIADFIEEEI